MQIRLWTTPPEETLELVKALTDKLTHKLKLPLDLLNMPICQQIEAHLLSCHSTKILALFRKKRSRFKGIYTYIFTGEKLNKEMPQGARATHARESNRQ